MDDGENEFDMLSDDESSASEEESDEDTESDNDDGSGDEDIITEECEDNGSVQVPVTSSDDDRERERCPVCLNRFIGQDLGTPESCDHTFCFDCIEEWSKNINTCPVDRKEFNYIYLRAVPGGSILQKIKVQPLPKEAEETLVESVTLCEVCHNGDREDRLLLCDGCDLAYHCECLDPPLFYIPIEEWFCPPCSGVLQNRAVAGPSHTRTRRIIPRTRASEAVRSRVQNLRTTGSSAPCSTSLQRKTNTTKSPKKRKRRYYRRKSFKKVVTLARTKKDLNNAQKGKLASRTSAVIVTYRRRRRRRRKSCKTRQKVSKKSVASSKVLTIPSAKQRIAHRLGISKPLQGSTVPQIKQSTGSRVISRIEKLPTHSLFGNKDQLMDFSENFAEDLRNVPSTSTSVSSRRCSNDSFSSTSCINILDSIMAGQKILHTKSDDIVIKTDGSLVLKKENSNTKVINNQKGQGNCSSHKPMSSVLAKYGVKSLTPSSKKLSISSSKKEQAEASITKDISERKFSKLSLGRKNYVIKPSVSQHVSKNISTNIMNKNSSSSVSRHEDKERVGKTSSSLNVPSRQQLTNKSLSDTKVNKFNGTSNIFQPNGFSDCETDLSNDDNCHNLKNLMKTEKQNGKRDKELDNYISTVGKCVTNKLEKCSSTNNKSSSSMSKACTNFCIKKEILSDNETDCDSITSITETMQIKKEVLSNEISNTNCGVLNSENQLHNTINSIITNIKKEPMDPEATPLQSSDHLNVQNSRNHISKKSSYENKDSQYNFSDDSKHKRRKCFIKIKEEILSDTEECSQLLSPSTDAQNFMLCSKATELHANNSLNSNTKNKIKKVDRYSYSHADIQTNLGDTSKLLANNLSEKKFLSSAISSNCNLSENDDLPCTQAVEASVVIDFDNDLPCTQAAPTSLTDAEDDEIPCTQTESYPTVTGSKGDLPCTQATFLSNKKNKRACNSDTDSEDDKLPCTQAAPSPTVIDSDDDLPCTQATFLSTKKNKMACNSDTDSEVDLPCTQATFLPIKKKKMAFNSNIDSENDELPCTQVAPSHTIIDTDDDLPCTQATFLSTKKNKVACNSDTDSEVDLPCTQATFLSNKKNKMASNSNVDSEDDDLPCTQAAPSHTIIDTDDDLPCTQATFLSTKINKMACNSDTDSEDDELPCTQAAAVPHFTDSDEDDDLPCNQAALLSTERDKITSELNTVSEDDNLSCTQVTPSYISTDIDEDNLPCTQVASSAVTDSGDKDLPVTQVAHAFNVTGSEYEDLPCTQAVFLPTKNSHGIADLNNPVKLSEVQCDSESFNLPATQISYPVLSKQTNVLCDGKLINSAKTHLDEEPENNNCNTYMEDILSNIKELVNSLSVKNTEKTQIMEDEEASCRNLPCQYGNSNISEQSNIAVESTNCKDEIEKNSKGKFDGNCSKEENTEKLHSSALSDTEELPHANLIEIARKSKAVSPKRIGIHKHLPQVIATVPVKELIKIKPSNKRTFSFEEVAKLEMPAVQKVSNSFPVEVIENKLVENSALDFDGSLPPTQKVNCEVIKNKPEKSKIICPELNIEKNKVNSILKHSQILANKTLESNIYKSDANLNVSHVENSEDLPATQVAICLSKSIKSVKFIPLTTTAAAENVESEISASNREDSILPSTQIQQFNNESNLSYVQKSVKSHLVDGNHKNVFLPTTTLKHEKSHGITLKSRSTVLKSGTIDSTKEPFNEFLHLEDDLPATQANNNAPINLLNSISECSDHSAKAIVNKSHKNGFAEKQMFQKKDVSSVIGKNLCKMKQHEESDNFKRPAPKRKSSSKDTPNPKEKHCDQNINILNSKELQNVAIKTPKNHGVSKRSLEYHKFDKEFDAVKSEMENLYEKLKQKSNEFDKQKLKKQKIKEDIENTDCMTKLSSKTFIPTKGNIAIDIKDKKQGFDASYPVTIKNEKNDFDFVKPSLNLLAFNSKKIVSLNDSDLVRIKSEDNSEDLLPATQLVNNDFYEDDLPATQVTNFPGAITSFGQKSDLSINQNSNHSRPSKIKKEVFFHDDDDDVSIIEFVASNTKIPKEVISLDDEGENTVSDVRAKATASFMNKEKCVENKLSLSRFLSKNKTTNITNNECVKEELKPCLSIKEHKQKCNNNSEKSKLESKGHKSSEKKESNKKKKCNEKEEKNEKKNSNEKKKSNEKRESNEKKESDEKKESHERNEKIKSNEKKKSNEKREINEKKKSNDKRKSNEKTESNKRKNCNEEKDSNEEKESNKRKKYNEKEDSIEKKENNKRKKCNEKKDSNEKKESNEKNKSKDLKGDKQIKHESQYECAINNSKHIKKYKDSKDVSVGKEEKQNDNLLRFRSTSASKSTKDFANSSIGKSKKKHDNNSSTLKSVSLTEKPISNIVNNESLTVLKEKKLKDSCDKEKSKKEKENCISMNKNTKHEVIITLKPIAKKRPHGNLSEKNGLKKMKYDPSLDSESCSSEDISNFDHVLSCQEKVEAKHNHSLDSVSCSSEDISVRNHIPSFKDSCPNFKDSNTDAKYECDIISDSASTPRSDKGLENVNVLNTSTVKISLKTLPTADVKKVIQEDLKEEIANEVKIVLKPFFKTGLISKDDYKDIMRRAVPKIFMNCHNCINPEKIRKLVLSYVSLLSKS